MPGDKKKIRPQDARRINVNEPDELRYWTKSMGVTPEQLKELVAKVGTSAAAVKAALQG